MFAFIFYILDGFISNLGWFIGFFFHFNLNFNTAYCGQLVETQFKSRFLWRLHYLFGFICLILFVCCDSLLPINTCIYHI